MPETLEASTSASTSAPSLDPNAAPPAPPPDTSGWTRDWVKDGAFNHAALDNAPDDFKSLRKELETFKTVDGMAKTVHELRALSSKKGASLLEPLPKDASPELRAERMAAIRQAVGAPDSPR